MTMLRRLVLAVATASILAFATAVPALAARDLVTVCRLTPTGTQINGILINREAWSEILQPNSDTNGFLNAGSACTT